MTADAAERWLADNAIDCGRYAARISPKACEGFRQASPESCIGCSRMTERVTPEAIADAKKRRFVNGSSFIKTPRKDEPKKGKTVAKKKHKVAECAACGRKMTIVGREKCSKCYTIQLKAEKKSAAPAVSEPLALPPVMSAEERMVALDVPAGVKSEFVLDLDCVLAELRGMLISKNAAYGDSALSPVRVFSQSDPVEQLRVRLDDKISRLMRGDDAGEDTVGDLMGYLVLLRIAERRA